MAFKPASGHRNRILRGAKSQFFARPTLEGVNQAISRGWAEMTNPLPDRLAYGLESGGINEQSGRSLI
jgi:hypothetical protein